MNKLEKKFKKYDLVKFNYSLNDWIGGIVNNKYISTMPCDDFYFYNKVVNKGDIGIFIDYDSVVGYYFLINNKLIYTKLDPNYIDILN